ncbi:MAG: hypothetical protein QM657_19220 [Lacrimispora sp.]|uniref:hypothetical protein n=1 Tax=Lacrimispora sp. TaxID=2719234 RepID=UPI0039E218C5
MDYFITKLINWFISLEGGEYVDFAILITIIIGGIFSLHQWKHSIKLKRMEFINTLIEKFREDQDISKIMYMFDYDYTWYNEKFHYNCKSNLEHDVDKTLMYLSYICSLHNNKLIDEKDMCNFEYEIRRALSNLSVQAYLFNLYHFSKGQKVSLSFKDLFEYGLKRGWLPERIIVSDSSEYPKYLNF